MFMLTFYCRDCGHWQPGGGCKKGKERDVFDNSSDCSDFFNADERLDSLAVAVEKLREAALKGDRWAASVLSEMWMVIG